MRRADAQQSQDAQDGREAHDRHDARSGFTLIEMVAAFAIASVVILATAALLHNVAFSFDRGTDRVVGGERLAAAASRLAADIAAAGFVLQKTPAGIMPAFSGAPDRVVFVTFQPTHTGPWRVQPEFGGQEVVSLAVEADGDTSQIVRRRGAWSGPRMPFANVTLGDDVVLLQGTFDASFKFARASPDGALTWVDSWSGEKTLPRLVKLTLRDRASGGDLLGGAAFAIRADAPLSCAAADANLDCLTAPDGKRARPAQPQATPQQQSSAPAPQQASATSP